MKEFVALLILILGIVLISGCTQVKDCGSDKECFLEAAKNCTPAKLTTSIESGEGDYKLSMDTESQISGLQGNDCIFSLQVRDLTVPPKMPSDLAQDFNNLKGSGMICSVPRNVEIKTFDELKEQVMNVYNERCTGTYKTLSEQLYQKMIDYWEKMVSANIQVLNWDCIGRNNATIIFRNSGTKDIDTNTMTVTRTSPTTTIITTISPATIGQGKTGTIYDENCGYGNMCRYNVTVGRTSQHISVLC